MLIQTYQSSWPDDFHRISEVIKEGLEGLDITVEHVGSTAIKDLAAKPIIDIDIVYHKNESFKEVKSRLEKLGYYHNGDQGIKGREVFKRNVMEKEHPTLDSIKHHLYVCHIENEELQRHLTFRDFLSENEEERKEYEKIKYEIAEKADQDRKVYAKLKEALAKEFIESILQKA